MTMKYDGSKSKLRKWLAQQGFEDGWSPEPHGMRMLRHPDGVQFHLSDTKGTVWFTGRNHLCSRLENKLKAAFALYLDYDEDDFDYIAER